MTALTLLFLIIITLPAVSLTACKNKKPSDTQESSSGTDGDDYAALILALQDKIESMKAEQSVADSKNDQKIDELKNTIESLRTDSESKITQETQHETTASIAEPHFTYTTEGNSATITGYTGNDESLVIPSYIDGYKVVGIADSAFKSKALKRVIVSEGIKSIGWFAFYDCEAMTSITIPSSVVSIGHSAFSSTAKITIYCHESSFAHQFAKSYGLDYALI